MTRLLAGYLFDNAGTPPASHLHWLRRVTELVNQSHGAVYIDCKLRRLDCAPHRTCKKLGEQLTVSELNQQ